MTISYVSALNPAGGTNSVGITIGALNAGDLCLLFAGSNDATNSTQNEPTVTHTQGFTRLGSFQGGAGTQGANTGERRLTVWYRVWQAGDSTSVTVNLTSGNSLIVTYMAYRTTTSWATPTVTFGADTVNDTSWDATGAADLGFGVNDWCVGVSVGCNPSATFGSRNLTAAGVVWSPAFGDRASNFAAVGNGTYLATGDSVDSAGSSSAAPRFMSTLTAASSGVTGFVRLAEYVPPTTGALWASGTPATTQTAGSWANATNATGANDGNTAVWTSTGSGASATITLAGYNVQNAIGTQPQSIGDVTVDAYAWCTQSTRMSSYTCQLTVNGTPVGSAQNFTKSTTVGTHQVFTFTGLGLTWAQVATLGVRITYTRGAVTTASNGVVDAASVNVAYVPAAVNATFDSSAGTGTASAAGDDGALTGTAASIVSVAHVSVIVTYQPAQASPDGTLTTLTGAATASTTGTGALTGGATFAATTASDATADTTGTGALTGAATFAATTASDATASTTGTGALTGDALFSATTAADAAADTTGTGQLRSSGTFAIDDSSPMATASTTGTGALTGTATFTATGVGDATAAGGDGQLVVNATFAATTTGDATADGGTGSMTAGMSIITDTGTAAADGGAGSLTGTATFAATTTGDATADGLAGALSATTSGTFTTVVGDATADGVSGALTASGGLVGTVVGTATADGAAGALNGGASIAPAEGVATADGGPATSWTGTATFAATTVGQADASGLVGALAGSAAGAFTSLTGNADASGGVGQLLIPDATLMTTASSATADGGAGALVGTVWVTLTLLVGNADADGGTGALTGQRNVSFGTVAADATADGGVGSLSGSATATFTTTVGTATADGLAGAFAVVSVFATTVAGSATADGLQVAWSCDALFTTGVADGTATGGIGKLAVGLGYHEVSATIVARRVQAGLAPISPVIEVGVRGRRISAGRDTL